MNELNIHSIIRAKKHYKTGGKHNIVDNKLNREFTSDKPNKKWVTNVTEIKINGNKLYLSTIMDIFNREIISYTISKRNNEELVIDMLLNAINKESNIENLILHSDQGPLYQSNRFRNIHYINIT